MSAPTALSTYTQAGSGTSVSVSIGSGSLAVAPGNSLIAVLWTNSAVADTPPTLGAGWSLLTVSEAVTAGGRFMRVAIARYDAASALSGVSLPLATIASGLWRYYALRFGDLVTAAAASDTGAASTAADTPSVPVPSSGAVLGGLYGCVAYLQNSVGPGVSFPTPPYSSSIEFQFTTGSGMSGFLARPSATLLFDVASESYEVAPAFASVPWVSAAVVLSTAAVVTPPVAADAGDRLRSSVSETTGSLLDAVDVRAVDASVSEAYTLAQALEPAILTSFREVTRERDSAAVDFAYFPRPRQTTDMTNQYDGVTVLSRLASYYPPRVFDTVDDDGLGITFSSPATAQQVIDYLLTAWAADTGWLTFEPVPDLRLRVEVGQGKSGYANPEVAQVLTEVIALPQERRSRRSALEILQDLLSPFPGTVLRQNSAGALEIVPTYGPDADENPHRVLTDLDVYGVSVGRPDPFSTRNRARVSATGYQRQVDVEVMQPAWFQVGGRVQFGRSNWFAPPNDRVNLQATGSGDALQETLATSNPNPTGAQQPAIWPISTERIPAGAGISLEDSVGDPLVTHAWARYFNDSLVDSGSQPENLTIVTPVIPFTGETVLAFQFDRTIGGEPVNLDVRARWDAARGGVVFSFGPRFNLETDRTTGTNGVIIEFTLNDASVGYVETPTTTGEFGFIDDPSNPTSDDDSLPSGTGGNAVAESQLAFGVQEASIDIRGYALSGAQLTEIARAYVLQNIVPRVTREVELSVAGSTLVTFDDLGRLVELPNGDRGFVTGVTYADDFTARSWRKTLTVEVRDFGAPGAVDPVTNWLLNDDLTFWQNDDGSFSEVF